MRTLVVGIAGGTACGKSTAANRMVSILGARCLHVLHDRYYLSLPDRLRGRPTDHNFDHPDALETTRLVGDLKSLKAGHPVRLPRYDFATHLRASEEDLVAPRPVVVVEGILVLADAALRDCLDHRVFITAPDDVRLVRRIRRDLRERGRRIEEILEQYERTVRPMHVQFVEPSRSHADVVLDGTDPVDEIVERLLSLPGVRE